MKERTFNTLFLISSVDGKISTGSVDKRDVDRDFPKIPGLKEGLPQYYALEKKTDLWSLCTGKVLAKIGMNEKQKNIVRHPVSFIIIDNKPHLNKTGVSNICNKCRKLILVTDNKNHPAFKNEEDNLEIIFYNRIDFQDLFTKLRKEYGIKKITIQSGGSLNAALLRTGLIDRLSLVVAPALIGGKDTKTLIEGESLVSEKDLTKIRTLKLKKCIKLKDSYLNLIYDVIN